MRRRRNGGENGGVWGGKKGYSSLQPGCSGFNRAILLTVGLFCSQSGYFALIGLLR